MSPVLDSLGIEVDMRDTIIGASFACVWRFKRYKGHTIERHYVPKGFERPGYCYSICGARHRDWHPTMSAVKGAIRAETDPNTPHD